MPPFVNKIASLLNIYSSEIKSTSLLIGIMLFSTFGYSLGGTGIEALYFARYGTDLLPYLYMGLGILSLITSLAITGLLSRMKRERMYVLIPLLAILFLFAAWVLLFSKSKFIFPALWLGKEALNMIISMITWNMAGAVCDSRQAKRLFPLFNASSILGSVLGGLGVSVLVNFIGTQNLVLIWGISMGLVFAMARILMRGRVPIAEIKTKSRVKRRSSSFIQDIQKGWRYVQNSSLMRWMSIAAILFSILYFSIALPFSKSASLQFQNENELASFLGLFNGLSTAAAFLTSIFFANRLYARFGIMNIILALPLIYLFGFSSLIVLNIFSVIVVFRFMQMLWLSGMADAAYQTMFSAVPPEKRDQVNAFLNGVPAQAGVFLAGIILIVGEQSFTSQQLYGVGLVAAIATSLIIWRASSVYRNELVNSLREGRPTIFDGRATTYDSTSLQVAIENITHLDPIVRTVAVVTLREMNQSEMLVTTLHDEDANVRIASLKGLQNFAPAILEVASLLSDVEPTVRAQAIHTLRHLSPHPHSLSIFLEPKLQDENIHVQIEAALGLLKLKEHSSARKIIRHLCKYGNFHEKIHALNAMSELGDKESYALIAEQLDDKSPAIRRAAALALASCGEDAIPILINQLGDEDDSVREGTAIALANIGEKSTPQIVTLLDKPAFVDGALIALQRLPIQDYVNQIKSFVATQIKSALYYAEVADQINPKQNERFALLSDSLHNHTHKLGIRALRGLGLLSDRESIQVAIENLQSKSPTQKANALETLEAVRDKKLIKPLLKIWDSNNYESSQIAYTQVEVVESLADDQDAWLSACAKFIKEGESMDTRTTLPVMERVLFLRHVPLFTDLSPADLQRIAALTTEHHAEKGEVIFEQGEHGEELFVIVHGEVQVMIRQTNDSEKEVARRKIGDVLGEMSIISGDPRSASVIATEETHLLCLDKKTFESLMREKPEVGFAVMRVLCERLKEATK
jgi:HEAT repeat protein/ATP/ADP translocase